MKYLLTLSIVISGFFIIEIALAQQQVPVYQQFRLIEGVVQISEPGEDSDLVHLWGDVNAPGRFMIPRGTTLLELISFSRGPASFRTGETTLEWSKLRIEINVSRRNIEMDTEEVTNFRFRYTEQVPDELRNYILQQNDVITLEVKRRPAFVDYMRIIGPIASIAATVLLLVDKL